MPKKTRIHDGRSRIGRKLRLQSKQSAAKRGYDRRWRKIRNMVLAEQPLCVQCKLEGLTVPADEVDHIIPLSMGGTHDPNNLQPLCKTHHSQKTNREQNRGKTDHQR